MSASLTAETLSSEVEIACMPAEAGQYALDCAAGAGQSAMGCDAAGAGPPPGCAAGGTAAYCESVAALLAVTVTLCFPVPAHPRANAPPILPAPIIVMFISFCFALTNLSILHRITKRILHECRCRPHQQLIAIPRRTLADRRSFRDMHLDACHSSRDIHLAGQHAPQISRSPFVRPGDIIFCSPGRSICPTDIQNAIRPAR